MTVASCPLCRGIRLPLRRDGSFRSHPQPGTLNACPATGRKPLTWLEPHLPGCDRCCTWLLQPGMAEAVGAYHLNQHKETL